MAGKLSDRDKIRHLLRRFGFGASLWEMEEYEKLGVQGTIDKLLDLSSDKDLVETWRFAFRKDEDAQPGGYRWLMHWLMHMLVTEHPLREKLALFWHDHFACSEGDVGDGLAMHDYMVELRTDPGGMFRTILEKMSKSTAVGRQLNLEHLSKARPNENFARELLELYTLGEGNYTEQDILEISRAMTGWAHVNVFYQMGKSNNERLKFMIKHDTPGSFFIEAPRVHIDGPKKVLGKTVDTQYEVLDLLADHPQTARYISKKLWEWFAYLKPEKAVVERLAKKFVQSKGEIIEVLREMTKMDEFWSEKCYKTQIKNPVDYFVGICRAQNIKPRIMKDLDVNAPVDSPIRQELISQMGSLNYYLAQTGMQIFYPPGVAGWDWGSAWISTNTVLRRRQFRGLYTYYQVDNAGKKEWLPDTTTLYVVEQVKKRQPQSIEAMVASFCLIYDCQLNPEQSQVLMSHFEKNGGIRLLENERSLAWVCTTGLNLLATSPEFQLC